MKSDFQPFIYGLVDPDESGHVRYVGMASVNAKRPYKHALQARNSTKSSYKLNWIRKIQSEGREPSVLILEKLPFGFSYKLLAFIEQCYIKSLREIGHSLTNLTDGGEGLLNPSPEVRERMRKNALGNKYSLGREQPQEEKERRGRSISRFWAEHPGKREISQETRDKISMSLLGYEHTAEARANMGASHIGSKRSDEARKNMRKAQLGREVSQETRDLISQRMTGRKHSEETRKRQSIGIRAGKSTPEARLDASIKAKEAWARRKAAEKDAFSEIPIPSQKEGV